MVWFFSPLSERESTRFYYLEKSSVLLIKQGLTLLSDVLGQKAKKMVPSSLVIKAESGNIQEHNIEITSVHR